jgi:hypothetical protein
MSETKRYLAVPSLSVPRYDDDGKITSKNQFVRGGDEVELDTELHKEFIERALKSGALVQAPDKPEQPAGEGSEVNGPGASTLIGTPALDGNTEGRLTRPADDATYADWVAFGKQEGLEVSGGKAAIIERADAKAKAAADDSQN